MTWCLDLPAVTNGPWRVLMTLADSANQENGCVWLHVSTLCRRTGMSRPTVLRHIHYLHSNGYIVPGDKRFVSHIDARHRPSVWRPNIWRGTARDLRGQVLPFDDDGVAEAEDESVDNPNSGVSELRRLKTERSQNVTLRGLNSETQNLEQNQTTDTDPAQREGPPRARTREAGPVSDLGTTTVGAVPPEQTIDHIAACRAAIRKDSE